MNRVIINADDLGLTKSKSDAICEAFKKHIVSDASMVANGDFFDYSVGLINKCVLNNIGIHFNITEGKPLTNKMLSCESFVNDSVFKGNVNRHKLLTSFEKEVIYVELSAQIKRLEEAGIMVDHADSHHHIHTAFNIFPIVKQVCKEHNINKIRIHRNIGDISLLKRLGKNYYNNVLLKEFITIDYFGSMEDVNEYGLYDNLEIMVHPDYDENGLLIDKIDEFNRKNIGNRLELPNGDYRLISYKDLI